MQKLGPFPAIALARFDRSPSFLVLRIQPHRRAPHLPIPGPHRSTAAPRPRRRSSRSLSLTFSRSPARAQSRPFSVAKKPCAKSPDPGPPNIASRPQATDPGRRSKQSSDFLATGQSHRVQIDLVSGPSTFRIPADLTHRLWV